MAAVVVLQRWRRRQISSKTAVDNAVCERVGAASRDGTRLGLRGGRRLNREADEALANNK